MQEQFVLKLTEIFLDADLALDESGSLLLIELDSLLVAEVYAALEDAAGHCVERAAFPPNTTTVADILLFGSGLPEQELDAGGSGS